MAACLWCAVINMRNLILEAVERWVIRKQSMSPYHPHTLNVNQPPRSAWCVVCGVPYLHTHEWWGGGGGGGGGTAGEDPLLTSLYRYHHQEAVRYYNIGTFVHQSYYLFIFLSKVSSSPVIQMKQSWHSECDMSWDSVVLHWIMLHPTGDYNNFLTGYKLSLARPVLSWPQYLVTVSHYTAGWASASQI